MTDLIYKKFLNHFSEDELKYLIEISDITSDNLICINTDKYFFEISSIKIYAIENSGESQVISKDKLFDILKEEATVPLERININ
jgi:hypothetical protein